MWNASTDFVKKVCEGRDSSHGYEHMKKVSENAEDIYNNTESEYKNDHVHELVMTVAILHDVNDEKYDPKKLLRQQIYEFLKQYYDETGTLLILNIIDRISYSKENNAIKNNQKLDWHEVLGDVGCFVRDIVSDADKLEAIGKIGIERCIEYTKHQYFEKNNCEISQDELIKKVIEHADEKLLRLKDHFIRTEYGRKLAESLHKQMCFAISDLLV
jgi:uncharacterized protein